MREGSFRSIPWLTLLAACSSGNWVATTWGEEYIEEGIPAAEFGDGCSAVYDRFEVEFASASLVQLDEEPGHCVGPATESHGSFDLLARELCDQAGHPFGVGVGRGLGEAHVLEVEVVELHPAPGPAPVRQSPGSRSNHLLDT